MRTGIIYTRKYGCIYTVNPFKRILVFYLAIYLVIAVSTRLCIFIRIVAVD